MGEFRSPISDFANAASSLLCTLSAGLLFRSQMGINKLLPFMARKNFQTVVVGVLAFMVAKNNDQGSVIHCLGQKDHS